MLNRLVVRFDPDGNQVDYLGQEDIGGTYLPYIHSLAPTGRGDLFVTTIASDRTVVFWYAADGTLLRRIDLAPETYPVPGDQAAVAILEAVHPDKELRRLYAKFDYHHEGLDGETEIRESRTTSRIYWMDISDGVYAGYMDVPRNTVRSGSGGIGRPTEYQYEFLGTAPNQHLFLLSQDGETSSQLLILNGAGRVVRRRTIEIDYDEVVFRDLHISSTGILSGLLASRESATVVWWRTDRLFSGR
jgi:hypothetical protein